MPAFVDLRHLEKTQRVTLAAAVILTAAAGGANAAGAGSVPRFVVAGLALAALAALVGQAIEQVSERLGPGPTALVQSTLGNVPELFVAVFALRDGLTEVVRAALVGSILGNTLLVLGCSFVAGGLRHGTQRFDPEEPRLNASLLLLVVAALLVPTLADRLGTPAAAHISALSNVCAIALLVVYAASVPFYLRRRVAVAADPAADQGTGSGRVPAAGPTPGDGGAIYPPNRVQDRTNVSGGLAPDSGAAQETQPAPSPWPLSLSVGLLVIGSLGAALAADWFVDPLQPAVRSLGLSQTFTGLVVVAIASNSVENAVGIRFALKAKPEYVISTTLNSPLQVALLLTPVLVLLSRVVGPTQLTLVFPPLLVAALAASAVVVAVVIYDGEYTWIEGVALIALYLIIAAAFWWG
jgi:Ca2+:H+ antiporter